MSEIEVGKSYICKPIGTNYEVIGYVECTYTNTAVIYFERYDQRDRSVIYDRKYRLLVKFCDMYSASKTELVS